LNANADQAGKFLLVRNGGRVTVNAGSLGNLTALVIDDGAHVTVGTGGTLTLGDTSALTLAAGGTSAALMQVSGGTLSVQSLSTLTSFIDTGGTLDFNAGTLFFRSSGTFSSGVIDQLIGPIHPLGCGKAISVDW